MKNHQSCKGYSSLANLILRVIIYPAIIFLPLVASGQDITLYDYYGIDMKHYSTEIISGTSESVMAGTIYDAPYNYIHFLRVDNTGAIQDEQVYQLNHADGAVAEEAHVTDIVEDPVNGIFYITGWLVPYGATNSSIFILEVDQNGNPQNQWDIACGDNFYTTHSVFFNKNLYICGYTNDGTVTTPSFGDVNQSFVLLFDPGTPLSPVCSTYNSTVLQGTPITTL